MLDGGDSAAALEWFLDGFLVEDLRFNGGDLLEHVRQVHVGVDLQNRGGDGVRYLPVKPGGG